jgi:hypothetical protein
LIVIIFQKRSWNWQILFIILKIFKHFVRFSISRNFEFSQ